MATDVMLIFPPDLMPEAVQPLCSTPYGEVSGVGNVLLREEGADPRALIYAAKELGARRVLAAEVVQPISPLLEEGDLLVPADVIDLTRLRPYTFFVGKGYGFIKLNPPFCPDLMATCLSAARQVTPRAFKGGVYVGAEGPRDATPAELRMYRQWGGDMVGSSLLPEAYLARELELCYAAIASVGPADLGALLRSAAGHTHGSVACTCNQTMKFMKEQGAVGEDWRAW